MVFAFAILRLATSSRASSARIRLLEKDTQSNMQRLAYVFAKLERSVGDTVADMMDNPGDLEAASDAAATHQGTMTTTVPAPPQRTDSEAALLQSGGAASKRVPQVQLSDCQRRMIASLNTLPALKKELVFINPVFNSHAVIISRDVGRFESHKLGEGVLRHWVDHFVM